MSAAKELKIVYGLSQRELHLVDQSFEISAAIEMGTLVSALDKNDEISSKFRHKLTVYVLMALKCGFGEVRFWNAKSRKFPRLRKAPFRGLATPQLSA